MGVESGTVAGVNVDSWRCGEGRGGWYRGLRRWRGKQIEPFGPRRMGFGPLVEGKSLLNLEEGKRPLAAGKPKRAGGPCEVFPPECHKGPMTAASFITVQAGGGSY